MTATSDDSRSTPTRDGRGVVISAHEYLNIMSTVARESVAREKARRAAFAAAYAALQPYPYYAHIRDLVAGRVVDALNDHLRPGAVYIVAEAWPPYWPAMDLSAVEAAVVAAANAMEEDR